MKVLLVLSVVVAVATPGKVHGGGIVHHSGSFITQGSPVSLGGGRALHGIQASHGPVLSHATGPVSHVQASHGPVLSHATGPVSHVDNFHGGAVVSVGQGVSHGSQFLSHDVPVPFHEGNIVSYGNGGGVHSVSAPVVVHGGVGDDKVDLSTSYSDYHFSWLHDGGSKYPWDKAVYYCTSLGNGWQGVSIETEVESHFINKIIDSNNLKYIWTGGSLQAYDWIWPSGNKFYGLNWGQTGAKHLPQPDNNAGNEQCLSVLNHFYPYDGITWHDIACHHLKPIICERPRNYGGYH